MAATDYETVYYVKIDMVQGSYEYAHLTRPQILCVGKTFEAARKQALTFIYHSLQEKTLYEWYVNDEELNSIEGSYTEETWISSFRETAGQKHGTFTTEKFHICIDPIRMYE